MSSARRSLANVRLVNHSERWLNSPSVGISWTGTAPAACAARCTSPPDKVLLAWGDDAADLAADLAALSLEPLTRRTVTDPQDLRDELARVRAADFALEEGECASGVRTVAVPVLDHTDRAPFADRAALRVPRGAPQRISTGCDARGYRGDYMSPGYGRSRRRKVAMRARAADEGLDKKQSSRPAATASERSRGPLRDSADTDALSPASMLGLQRSIGNTAVNRVLAEAPAGQSIQRAPSGAGAQAAAPAPAPVSVEHLRAVVESAYIRKHVPELKNWATGADDALPYRVMTTQGDQWHRLDQHDGAHATQATGRAYVAAKSQADVTEMGHELGAHGDADGWQSAVRHKLESAVRASVLRHYTIDTRVEQMLNGGDAGAMKSKMKLDRDTANAAHNTGDFDLYDLANHGFVFFYIEPKGTPFRPSRFSEGGKPVRITLPIAQVVQNGWIMLNDFLDMEVPTLRSDAEGNLLSYRRDEDKANSPEAKMYEAHLNRAQAIERAWQDNPGLNQRAAKLAAMLSHSFAAGGAEAVGPEQTRAITHLLSSRSRIEQHMKANGMDNDLAELKQQFAKSVQYNVQVRRFEPDDDRLGGEARYMSGTANAESRTMKALPGAMRRYRQQMQGNILAGPHIISGLALRGVLEIARIEAQGGHGALVNRMKAMSGDELLRMLLKDFIRPQAMVPWAVRIKRSDVEAMP